MESSLNFNTHLHNGDPLTQRTTHVPVGRPAEGNPPFTWEESAVDSLKYQGLDKWADWTMPGVLYKLEEYNGWGYRLHHSDVLSPYLWSFSNNYTKGKYTADGSFSPDAVSQQCGAAVLLKILAEKGEIVLPDEGTGGECTQTDISYDVPLIPQPDKYSCWAASMAMILGSKRMQSISPESLASEVGRSLRTCYSWDMLEDVRNHFGFVSVIDVPENTSVYYKPEQWKSWLEQYGPLWFTVIWPDNPDGTPGGSHALVLMSICGDLTPDGTTVKIQDPWDSKVDPPFDNDPVDFNPENKGCTESMSFKEFCTFFGDRGYDAEHSSFRIMYLYGYK
jgi:hypothetical protein